MNKHYLFSLFLYLQQEAYLNMEGHTSRKGKHTHWKTPHTDANRGSWDYLANWKHFENSANQGRTLGITMKWDSSCVNAFALW